VPASPSRSKHGNIPTVFQGHRYASRKEATYAAELELRRRAGDVRFVEPHHPISLDVNGVHVCTYIADFRLINRAGEVEYVDVKGGELTPVFKLKMKLLAALHPEITVKIVR
jgi:hypothetical protein